MIVAAADVAACPVALVGGKGAGLGRLVALGCPVPPFLVLTTDAWRAGTVPAALIDAVTALGPGPYAVRSSADVEDAATASWAGQFESVLGVPAADAVPAAVERCWASARSERVAAYAAAHGVAPGAMAVVVQRLVEGEASGVLFTRDPDDPDRALLSVGLGLGEGVVQGTVACDTYRVGANDAVEAEIADKDEEVVREGDHLVCRPVTGGRAGMPALTDAAIRDVVAWGRRLEAALGAPMDVEFTVAHGRTWLLQVRPITVPVPTGRRLLWDNSNIIESYSGVTTPLTFSFASAVYTIVYQLFCRVMGVPDAAIQRNLPTYRRMIGLFGGRIYYNLNAWYRVLSLLPGFQFNRGAMETMMGVSEVASDEDAGLPPTTRWREALSLARLLGRLGWRLFRLERDAAAFQRTFDAAMASARERDPSTLRPDELLALYEDIEQRLLWGWTPPLVNDFFCMIFYKLLQSRCQRLTGDADTQLHNELLAGEGTLASAAPANALRGLARVVASEPALRELARGPATDADVLAVCLGNGPFTEGWDAWMARYGDRSPDELKLESPTLRDTPEFLMASIRAYARDPDAPEPGADPSGRATAEATAFAKVGAVGRPVFRFILGQARRRVALRESLRFERTRVFGVVRNIFRAFGERFAAGGHLDAPGDVFFLTVDEILGFVRGTAASTDLRGLVAVRRAEHVKHLAAAPLPDRFYTWGAAHHANAYRGTTRSDDAELGDEIRGTPCSPGQVRAPAVVVTDPRERPDLRGGILVAHRTDPGWVPLFPTASAVLVERGSLLSHSAVVAREFGLPAIVGIRGLLSWVEDGETLGMDGSSGRIWRVDD